MPHASSSSAEATWTPPSWEQVVQEHSARVYRLAYRLTGNRQDAEDLTQEVFVRVFRSLSSYTPGTFEGWLHRITTNLFLDQVRRKQRIRFDSLPDDAGDRLAGSGDLAPERAWEHNNLDHDVQRALDTIPAQWDQGYRTFCIKPSQFTDDPDGVGAFCRDVMKRAEHLV